MPGWSLNIEKTWNGLIPVISTNIANTVSCKEKQRSSGEYFPASIRVGA